MADVSRDLGQPLGIRIGLHTGPVAAGIIGTERFAYDVWGDTVNLAARLESVGTPGRILVCPACRQRRRRECSDGSGNGLYRHARGQP